jgi:hypothetical protein
MVFVLITCGIGSAIPPREGRVRATSAFTRVFDALWRGGGEKPMRNGDFSPPGRRKRVYARLRPAMAATLPSRGGMRPPVSRSLQPQAIML